MDLLEQINRTAFLGAEFLTWLWYRTEASGELFHVPDQDVPFEIWFDDRLVVGSTRVNAQENFFKGGHPSSSLEARTALRLGKLATQARLRLVRDNLEWSFVMNATELNCTGVKLPPVLAKEAEEKLYERMYLIEQLDQMVKGLFGLFLRQRISGDWMSQSLPDIQGWVGQTERESTASRTVPTPAPAMTNPPAGETNDGSGNTASSTPAPDMPRNEDVPPWEDPIGE
ncbi:MAG: hypothetical protein VX589_17555 [Myxococcota bacterium]|nr:hypothetical protein [Myxococcota bacterium]